MSKSLIVYFSRSGHTRKVAEAIAGRIDCDVEEIREPGSRNGVFGYLRSAKEALREAVVEIEKPSYEPGNYDLVIVGTPVWAGNMSSPVRTYVTRLRSEFRDVAFFCTQGGRGSAKVFSRLETLTGKTPRATLVLTQGEVDKGRIGEKLTAFVAGSGLAGSRGNSLAENRKLRAVPD